MAGTWIVVAESSRARIFDVGSSKGPLNEINAFDHPEARMRETELSSDSPGRRFATAGPKRHGMAQPVSVKEEQTLKFARDLAQHLEAQRARGRFDRLVLAAPPKFLGSLREVLTPATSATITREYGKNWVQHDAGAIRQQLPEYL